MESQAAPLAGIRVIDLSRVLAGPYCALLLSFLGAEVIKVEDHKGDEGRQWPPHREGMGATFMGLNANKRSIAVDLKHPQGAEIVKDLVRDADVLVENFKTGDMERFGLGYETLRQINPRLVYTSISAFGRVGPRAKDLGYEALVQAYSGVMNMTGEADGGPVRCGVSFLDTSTGAFSALATVTALYRRRETGQGARVDASLLQTSWGLMSNHVSNYFQHGTLTRRHGTAHPQVVPYQAFRTRDGFIFIATGNQNLWERFCKALQRRDLINDERFIDNMARVAHRQEILDIVIPTIAAWDTEPLMHALRAEGVPFSRVNDLQQVAEDGQIDALEIMAEGEDPTYGGFRISGLPFKLTGHSIPVPTRAPRLGEHTRELLARLGYDQARIDELLAGEVVLGA
ncbi:MAG: CoA transferase [Candidatus Lambdaproteobacteria bacterium]|nr:CoA transferase [Candidatus Lambdaproteobacteria bacterium]